MKGKKKVQMKKILFLDLDGTLTNDEKKNNA